MSLPKEFSVTKSIVDHKGHRHCAIRSALTVATYQLVVKYQRVIRYPAVVRYLP